MVASSTISCRRRTTRPRSSTSPIGAERAGRRLDDIDRPQLVVCSLDDDRRRALDNARLLVTQYLGQQPHIMKASGVPESLLEDIGRVLTWPATHDQVVAASKLVPDDVVQMITASGTAEECRAKVAEYVAAGCTCPILYPLGDDVRAMIDAFAPAAAPWRAAADVGGHALAGADGAVGVAAVGGVAADQDPAVGGPQGRGEVVVAAAAERVRPVGHRVRVVEHPGVGDGRPHAPSTGGPDGPVVTPSRAVMARATISR